MATNRGIRFVRNLAGFVSVQGEQGFISSGRSDSGQFVPAFVADLLEQCDVLRTTQEHAAHYRAKYRGLRRFRFAREAFRYALELGELGEGGPMLDRALVGVLNHLGEQGYLQTEEQLAVLLTGAAGEHPPGRIGALVIATSQRPELLRRVLRSYLTHLKRHHRDLRVVVGDDSPNAQAEAENAQVIEEARAEGARIEHLTRAGRLALIEQHAKGDRHRREALEFLLIDGDRIGRTYGQSRNALLWATGGELIFSADDDTLGQPLASPRALDDVRLCAWDEPTHELSRWPSREAALAQLQPMEGDLFARHEQVLGRPPGAVLAEALRAGKAHLPALDREQRAMLLSGVGQVALSTNGLVGDSASVPPLPSLLEARGAEAARLMASRELLAAVAKSREVVKLAPELRLAAHGGFMTTFFGLDNRTLTVPFFPYLRRSDLIFKEMLLRVRPGALVAHLPFALGHEPIPREIGPWPPVAMSDVFLAAFREIPFAQPGLPEADQARALGHRLVSFAEQPLERYRRAVRETVLEQRSALLAMRQEALDAFGKHLPGDLAESARESQTTLRRQLTSEMPIAEPALIERFGAAADAENFARLAVVRMGRALVALNGQ